MIGNILILSGIVIIVAIIILAFITVKNNPKMTPVCIVGIIIVYCIMAFTYNPSMKKMELDLKEMRAKMERYDKEFKSIDQLIKELLGEIKNRSEHSGGGYTLPSSLPKAEGDKHFINIR